MADIISKKDRSKNMSAIKCKNTKPELIVRKLLFSLGYRYRLHSKDLPGKPDVVLKKYNSIIFVHGCFWHHHKGCKRSNWPKSNIKYWIPKIKKNIERDKNNSRKLKKQGWNTIVIWECQVKNLSTVRTLLLTKLKEA